MAVAPSSKMPTKWPLVPSPIRISWAIFFANRNRDALDNFSVKIGGRELYKLLGVLGIGHDFRLSDLRIPEGWIGVGQRGVVFVGILTDAISCKGKAV